MGPWYGPQNNTRADDHRPKTLSVGKRDLVAGEIGLKVRTCIS